MKRHLISIALLLLFALPLAGTRAHALTPPGTEIKNWASVTYSVGGVPLPEKVTNITAFKVLELIDATVVWQDAANVAVEPGTSKAVMTFSVSSSGNGFETFALGVDTSLAGDDFNPTLVSLYLDSDANGLFDPSLDTLYIAGGNDPNLPPLGSVTVFVLCDIPKGLSTATIGQLQLTATSTSGFGNKGEILPNLGDSGVDAMLGFSGGQAKDIGAYEATVSELPLTLTKNGDGSVSSFPAGIACGSGCSTQNASYLVDSSVTLTATPTAGNVFAGWSGACSGTDFTCTVVMSESRNVTATFVAKDIPIGTILINHGEEWTASRAVTLTLAASDDQGIVSWFVSESSTPPTAADPGWQSVTSDPTFATEGPFTLGAGDGVKTLYAWYRDADGNVSYIASDTIMLDTTPPVSTANPPGGTFSSAVTVALSCDDGQGIGCATIYYTTDGSIPTTASAIYSTPLTFAYSTTMNFFSLDKLGNGEGMQQEIYLIDAPGISSQILPYQSSSLDYPVGANIADDQLRIIPSAYHQEIITISNSRTDALENVEVMVSIPETTKYCIDRSLTGVDSYLQILEGTPASGLTLGDVLFSNDNGINYNYTLQWDGDDCDDAVTNIKVLLSGTFNPSDGTNDPYLVLEFAALTKNAVPGTVLDYGAEMTYLVNNQPATIATTASGMVAEIIDVVTTWQDTVEVVSTPGEKDVVSTFKVSNLGNGSESFALTVDASLADDDFDPSLASIWLDSDGDGQFDTSKDSRYLPGNEPILAANSALAVFVLCDIPALGTLDEGFQGKVSLTATATTSGAAAAGTVFTKVGDRGVDAVVGNSGASSAASSTYEITSVKVVVLKSVLIVSDPVGNNPPLPLTGSVLRYTLKVTAEGKGSAERVVVSDRIPANTHYMTGSLTLDTDELSDVIDADAGAANALAIEVNIGRLSSGVERTITFEVTID